MSPENTETLIIEVQADHEAWLTVLQKAAGLKHGHVLHRSSSPAGFCAAKIKPETRWTYWLELPSPNLTTLWNGVLVGDEDKFEALMEQPNCQSKLKKTHPQVCKSFN